MNSYYSRNALYDRLEKAGCRDFHWAAGNSWVLLYGDGDGNPKLVVFASGRSTEDLSAAAGERLRRTLALAEHLAGRADLPFATIGFDDRAAEISEVSLNGTTVGLDELKAWFSKSGLAVQGHDGRAPLKAINDASSSAYHNWQRAALGRIVVTDIDLIRTDAGTGAFISLYELKRSYLSLEDWTPFTADYPNFNMISGFTDMAKVDFQIVYNVRHKKPRFFDDASRLSVFSYSRATGPRRLAVISFDDFVRKAR